MSLLPLPKHPKEVLFVCTGNSCRSVMAEGLFRKMAQERSLDIAARSCGTSALEGIGASIETRRVMKDRGVDVGGHRGRKISPDIIDRADIIFVMQTAHRDYVNALFPDARDRVYLLSDFYPGEKREFTTGIPDPIGMGGEFYQNVLEVIQKSLEGVFERLQSSK